MQKQYYLVTKLMALCLWLVMKLKGILIIKFGFDKITYRKLLSVRYMLSFSKESASISLKDSIEYSTYEKQMMYSFTSHY